MQSSGSAQSQMSPLAQVGMSAWDRWTTRAATLQEGGLPTEPAADQTLIRRMSLAAAQIHGRTCSSYFPGYKSRARTFAGAP